MNSVSFSKRGHLHNGTECAPAIIAVVTARCSGIGIPDRSPDHESELPAAIANHEFGESLGGMRIGNYYLGNNTGRGDHARKISNLRLGDASRVPGRLTGARRKIRAKWKELRGDFFRG
ncbi:hypothetical protein Zmor_005271 [Zophobas morio]|uniref:Uncharacterized protein n=1 Tax=Zophobas morio TaxID=2755281 RepID=A0AA38IPL4_9CUCU|nr:hypothetical protein Zmor_005271 [Zophobas morio]